MELEKRVDLDPDEKFNELELEVAELRSNLGIYWPLLIVSLLSLKLARTSSKHG